MQKMEKTLFVFIAVIVVIIINGIESMSVIVSIFKEEKQKLRKTIRMRKKNLHILLICI